MLKQDRHEAFEGLVRSAAASAGHAFRLALEEQLRPTRDPIVSMAAAAALRFARHETANLTNWCREAGIEVPDSVPQEAGPEELLAHIGSIENEAVHVLR